MAAEGLTVGGAGSGATAPLPYIVPGAGQIILKGAFARLDGTSATSFQPCLRVKTPNGAVMFECVGATVAGGGAADVTWFHGLVASAASSGGTQTMIVPVIFDAPDASANGYPAYSLNNGFSNVTRVVPSFTHAQLGTWYGAVRIPPNYESGGQVIVSSVTNATSGVVRYTVGSAVVAAAVSEDTNYTTETAVNTTVPGTALQRFDVTFTLSTTLAASSTLNLFVQRQGNNAADTLTTDTLMWECLLSYTGNT